MKTIGTLLIVSLFFTIHCFSQSSIDSTGIQLQKLAVLIQEDTLLVGRFKADSIFTRTLVTTLKTPYSFNFKLDSLKSVNHIVSPDGKFKFFTWQLDLGDGTFRQRGAMQFPTKDGQLKLLPFFDNSDFIANPSLGVFDRKKWIGAIYYQIIPITFKNETWYTLLGFDENTLSISKKIIEVVRFEKDEPIFGGDFFNYPADPTYPKSPVDRFIYQYKKGSNAIISYDREFNKIRISQLTSTENDLTNPATLVPTGIDLFFEWKNGKWDMPKKSIPTKK